MRAPVLSAVLAATLTAATASAQEPSPAESAVESSAGSSAEPPDFQRDVLPILSDRCFACHGPDEAARKAGLRLDRRDDAIAPRGWKVPAIAPGNVDGSGLWLAIRNDEDGPEMPPSDAGPALTETQRDVLRRWIESGAEYREHWAFVKPERPAVPEVDDGGWGRNPIDAFAWRRLEALGLEPQPEADAGTLVHRAALDLTGLPPSAEVLSQTAFEDQLDALFASPRHGEHMARYWLDAARYGDTHGFHLDNVRALWPWRDWVIEAFQQNKPFDAFTIEQLAGDLLPDPTVDQRVATGFVRCNPTTGEGGLIEDEYLARYAKDRVETMGTVWLGLTVGCANCHDHKYDPLSQREYYSLYAYFNSLDEEGTDRNALTPRPSLTVPSEDQQAQADHLDQQITAQTQALAGPLPQVDAHQPTWEANARQSLLDWHPLTPLSTLSEGGATLRSETIVPASIVSLEDAPPNTVAASGELPSSDAYVVVGRSAWQDGETLRALRLRVLAGEGQKVGRASHGNIVLSRLTAQWTTPDRPLQWQPLPLAAVTADHSQLDYSCQGVLDENPASGWALSPQVDRSHELIAAVDPEHAPTIHGDLLVRVRLEFASQHPQHSVARFALDATTDNARPATWGTWSRLGPVGKKVSTKIEARLGEIEEDTRFQPAPEFVDGKVHMLPNKVGTTWLTRTVESPAARTIRLALGSDDSLELWCNGEPVLDRDVRRPVKADQDRATVHLRAGTNRIVLAIGNSGGGHGFFFRVEGEDTQGVPLAVAEALAIDAATRTERQRELLQRHYRRQVSEEYRAMEAELADLRARRKAVVDAFPRTMVAARRADPRPAHVMMRGQYDQLGETVEAATPAFLHDGPDDAAQNRLGLARWLVSPDNPLTARVTVNRLWAQVFGRGLVGTAEDFGLQGERPSHPELLDWLACELVDSGWDQRHILRLIFDSATWRQRATASRAALERDPDGRFLSRSPRTRLDAEVIRDRALWASGLLVEKVGGPSVKPYQPPGIWFAVGYTSSNTARFVQDQGDKLYRRSLYTFWKRTAPPPVMALFDAPTRESCVVQRSRTNTPLQALALMNDVQFVEAARHFGAWMANRETNEDTGSALRAGFERAIGRQPNERELQALRTLLTDQLAMFSSGHGDPAALLAVGDSPAPEGDPIDLAAWTMVAQTLLNADAFVTRP